MTDDDVLDAHPLLFLVGTTASGKSRLGLELAERRDAEIVSLDSMSVYRGMDVGTAKPSPEERERVPHHLIDVADPRETFDLQAYLGLVREALRGIGARGRRALWATRTCWMMHGSGAVRWQRLNTPSPTASGTIRMTMRIGPICPPSATSFPMKRSA